MVAVKTGNLDKIKPEETVLKNSHQKETTGQNMVTLEQNQKNNVDKKASSDNLKSSKEIKVEHTLVLSPRHSDIEHIIIPKEKMRPKLTCCVVS